MVKDEDFDNISEVEDRVIIPVEGLYPAGWVGYQTKEYK